MATSVASWGWDLFGQLGDGGYNADQPLPVTVEGLVAGPSIMSVAAAGGNHSLALRADGSVVAWGMDKFGELGDGAPNRDRSTPVEVSGLGAGSGVVALAAGSSHNLALRADGSVVAWGSNESGQLAPGRT